MRGRGTVGSEGGDPDPATSLRDMLYVDNARVVSQWPEKFRKIMAVIVIACTAFGLTAAKAKAESTYLQKRDDGCRMPPLHLMSRHPVRFANKSGVS